MCEMIGSEWILCKPCARCGRHCRPSEHGRDKRAKNGLDSYCLRCARALAAEQRARHPGAAVAHSRAWRRRNKAKGLCACGRERAPGHLSCAACMERCRVAAAAWQDAHPEEHAERCLEWRETHREEARAIARKWAGKAYHGDATYRMANAIRCRTGAAVRKWLKTGEITEARDEVDFAAIIRSLGEPPGKWGKGPGMWSIDHIVPLRLLRLDDPMDLWIAWHKKNVRWEEWTANRRRGQEWDDEAVALYAELAQEWRERNEKTAH